MQNENKYYHIVLFCMLILFSPAVLFSQGEIFLSLWNRSYFSDVEIKNPYEYETDYHFGLTQMISNYGRLQLWLDGIQTQQAFKLGRGLVSFDDLSLGKFLVNSSYGDTHFTFTNLEDRFSNTYYPYVYLRGGKLNFSSSKTKTVFFGGKAANLRGIFGTTYEISEQSIYGFNTRLQPFSSFSVGAGYIYTENEKDSAGELLTRSNNIFLFDSELRFSEKIKILGEYKFSHYLPGDAIDRKKGFSLRVGPIIRTERLTLEANYRHIGPDYRFVSSSTQLERDQEGYFLLMDYKINRYFSIIGNADRYKNNIARDPLQDTVYTTRGLMGLSFYSPSWPSLSFRFSVTDRETRRYVNRSVDSIAYNYYFHIYQNFHNFNLYLRYFKQDAENRIHPSENTSQDTFNLGIRHSFKRNNLIWLEGEMVSNKDFTGEEIGHDLRGRIGINYYYSANFRFYSIATYSKWKGKFMPDREKLDFYLTLNFRLPLGFNLSLNLGSDRYLTSPLKEIRGTNYRFTVKIDKRLRWGKPLPRMRGVPGVEIAKFGAIHGYVFDDLNLNGIKDSGERGYSGIKITLQDGTAVETDVQGKFKFSRVPIGQKKVRIDLQGIPIELNFLDETEKSVEVTHRKTVDVSFRLITSAVVSGRVINDANKNGQIDPDEEGMSNVLIWLKPADETLKIEPLNTYTDKDGKFVFEYIIPGKYILFPDKESLPERTIFTATDKQKIEVLPGEKLKNQKFLIFVPPRPIRIYSDNDIQY